LDEIETNGDLERVTLEAIAALDTCNEDKTKIREWQEAEVDENV
jgi:hypothetical protein